MYPRVHELPRRIVSPLCTVKYVTLPITLHSEYTRVTCFGNLFMTSRNQSHIFIPSLHSNFLRVTLIFYTNHYICYDTVLLKVSLQETDYAMFKYA